MKRSRTMRIAPVAGLAAIAMLAAACGSGGGSSSTASGSNAKPGASAPGITASSITIGSTQPLTGPAAPGYSEISQASEAYFQYVNAHGGIFGRKINYIVKNDQYNPSITSTMTRQLVLNDNVFADFDALGTPTHLAVAPFLNSEKVRTSSWRRAASAGTRRPPGRRPSAGSLTTCARARSSATTSRDVPRQEGRHLLPERRVRPGRGQGPQLRAPGQHDRGQGAATTPTNTAVGPAVAKLKASGAQVVVSFSIPAFTALLKLNALGLSFNPTLVVSDVGSDAITLSGLLQSFAAQSHKKVIGNQLIQGIITDGYLPSLGTASTNTWLQLFSKIHTQYISKLPFDGNVEYGMAVGVLLRPGHGEGGQEPDPAGPADGHPGAGSRRARPCRPTRTRRPTTSARPVPTWAPSRTACWSSRDRC